VDSGGRHGAPLGRLDSTRTPGLHKWLAHGVLSCARGCGLLYLLSAEGDNILISYKESAHMVELEVTARLEPIVSEHVTESSPYRRREPAASRR